MVTNRIKDKITKEKKDSLKKQVQLKKDLQDVEVSEGEGEGVEDLDISDQSIDALKYALYYIIHNKGSLAGTTNLNKNQIRAIAKMKGLNFFYRSQAIYEFMEYVLELQRSETSNPVSILESIGNLFRTPQMNQGNGFFNKARSLIRR